MRTLTAIIIGVVIVIAIGLFVEYLQYAVWLDGWSRGVEFGKNQECCRIKSIAELQMQVGAKPDGIWGRETNKKYDLAYCNQSAEIWFGD